jgi:hypothetical protein
MEQAWCRLSMALSALRRAGQFARRNRHIGKNSFHIGATFIEGHEGQNE